MRSITIIMLLSMLFAGLHGCHAPPKSDTAIQHTQEQIEHIRTTAKPDRSPLKRIRIPRTTVWLDKQITARFNNLDARSAIDLVVQNRPVRYNTGDSQVLVKWSPSAVTIRDHLDSITAQADWSYRVEKGAVQVYDIETRYFALAAQPGATAANMNLRNLSDSGGGSADNSIRVAFDPYATELVVLIRSILGLAGSTLDPGQIDPRTAVSILPSANQIVVTARPHVMRKVENIIDRYNLATSSIVRVQISILEVDISDAEKHSLLIDIFRRSSNLAVGLGLFREINEVTGALAATVTNTDSAYGPTGGNSGSRIVYQWLQQFGDTSIAYDDTIEILNNHVASIDATRTEQYVAKISRATTTGGGTETSTPEVTFAELRTGLAIHLQPTVQDRRITLRMALSRSTPVERLDYNFDGIAGTNFVTDDFNRVLSVSLIDGEPKLLASFSEAVVRNNRERIPFLGSLGNSRNSDDRKRETIMLITAGTVSN